MASGNVASRAEVGASVDILTQNVYRGEDPGAFVARYTDVIRSQGTSGTRSSKNGRVDLASGDSRSGWGSGGAATISRKSVVTPASTSVWALPRVRGLGGQPSKRSAPAAGAMGTW